MKTFKWAVCLLTLALFPGASCLAANGDIRTWASNIAKFNAFLPQEKVYIHFDNTSYFKRKKMWFKCYITRSDTGKPTDVSRVLYVELLDASGNVLDTQKLQVDKGQASGVFDLRNVLAGGYYEVRAYTRYMLNWDSSWMFSRIFPIYNAPEHEGDYSKAEFDNVVWQKRPGAENSVKENIHFFPEGGHLVAGLPCHVAFEARNEKGQPTEAHGSLLADGKSVATVETIHEGRGAFYFTPQTGKSYTLQLTDEDGKTLSATLPEPETEGCALQVKQNGASWKLLLTPTNSVAADLLGVLLTSHGTLRHLDVVKAMAGKTLTINLPDTAIADGVNRLSIVSAKGDVVADRLFFSYPKQHAERIRMKVISGTPTPSEYIDLAFRAQPSSTFSLSVRDAATEKGQAADNCETWLLLTGELHGYVFNPSYYLEADDSRHRKAADLLMMVQGWRRYDLAQMMGRKRFTINYQIEKCLNIIGKLKPTRKKFSVANMPLRFRLYNQQGQTLSGTTTSDANGYYTMLAPACAGEWTMFVNTDKHYRVGIDRNFSPAPRLLSPMETLKPFDFTPATTNFQYADSLATPTYDSKKSMTERTHTLKNVLVKKHFWETGIAWDNEREGRKGSFIHYNVDKEVDQMEDEFETTPIFIDWLMKKNKDFGGTYYDVLSEGNDTVTFFGRSADGRTANQGSMDRVCDFSYKNKPVLFIVNNRPFCVTNLGMREQNTGELLTSRSIEHLPVMLEEARSVYVTDNDETWKRYVNPFGMSSMATVFVYTHKMFTKCPKGLRRTTFHAYDTGVEFYNVQRGDLPAGEDHRRTLFWSPNITTDASGKAKVKLFNTPQCRQLIISAEAITPDGKAMKN